MTKYIILSILLVVSATACNGIDQSAPDAMPENPDSASVLDAIAADAHAALCVPDSETCYDISVPEAELGIDDLCKPALASCEWDRFRYWIGAGQCVTFCCPAYAGNPLFECRWTCGTDTPSVCPPARCSTVEAGANAAPLASCNKADSWVEESP